MTNASVLLSVLEPFDFKGIGAVLSSLGFTYSTWSQTETLRGFGDVTDTLHFYTKPNGDGTYTEVSLGDWGGPGAAGGHYTPHLPQAWVGAEGNVLFSKMLEGGYDSQAAGETEFGSPKQAAIHAAHFVV